MKGNNRYNEVGTIGENITVYQLNDKYVKDGIVTFLFWDNHSGGILNEMECVTSCTINHESFISEVNWK